MAPKQPLIDTDPKPTGMRRWLIPRRPPAARGVPDAWDDRRAALALERCADGFASIDERGRVIAWNPAAERILGWRGSEVIGRPLVDFAVPERLRAEYERTLATFAADGDTEFLGKPFETTARRRGGREIPVELSVSALRTAVGWCYDAWVRDAGDRPPAAIAPEDREGPSLEAARALATLERETARIARLAADLREAAQTSSGDLGAPPRRSLRWPSA
jgi:two-component system, sensor histidine kinase and response regulator